MTAPDPRHYWRAQLTDADIDRRFTALAEGLTPERDIFADRSCAADLIAMLERCSAGALPAVPPAALAAAAIDGCLGLSDLPVTDRNRRYKALERHATALRPHLTVSQFLDPLPAASLGIDAPGCGVNSVVYIERVGLTGWVAGRIVGPFGDMGIHSRMPHDPWAAVVASIAQDLRGGSAAR